MRFEILSYGSDDPDTERYQLRMSKFEAKLIAQALAVICHATRVMDRNGVDVPDAQVRARHTLAELEQCGIY